MMLYTRLERWPECNALAQKLLLKKWVNFARLSVCLFHSSWNKRIIWLSMENKFNFGQKFKKKTLKMPTPNLL